MRNSKRHIIYLLVNACRFIMSAVFIFSGFVKAVDPKGFAYKIEEYLFHFHLDVLTVAYVPVMLAVLISSAEFLLGIYIFWGIRKRFATFVALLFMLVVTPFTVYIYLYNPVSDCGCFGDALILSNSATLCKNVCLLLGSVVLLKNRHRLFRIVSERNQWLISIYSIIFILVFSAWSFYYLPILDFRPYHVGANIPSLMARAKQPVYETEFILEKDGRRETFTLDNYPDSTWTFIDSRTRVVSPSSPSSVADFYLSDATGLDATDELLSDSAYAFWLIAPDLSSTVMTLDAVNEIYDYCIDHRIGFYCITASSMHDIEQWKQYIGFRCPTLIADRKLLQTIVRSDPGLLLVKSGTVWGKWSKNNFPAVSELQELVSGDGSAARNYGSELLKILLWYIIPLLFITLADRMWIGYKFYRRYEYRKTILIKRKKDEKENCSR